MTYLPDRHSFLDCSNVASQRFITQTENIMNQVLSILLRGTAAAAVLGTSLTATAQVARLDLSRTGCPSVTSLHMCETLKRVKYMLDEKNILPGNLTGGIKPPVPRDEFAKLEASASQAASELQGLINAKLGNRSPAEFDQLMLGESQKAGAPDAVLAAVRAAGGPAKVFANADGTIRQGVSDLRSELKIGSTRLSADRIVAMLTLSGDADARLRGTGCSLFVYVLTFGYGTQANYNMCMQ
jgi:hypothetical protein